MKQLFFLASLLSLMCISCKSKKEAKSSETSSNTNTTAPATQPNIESANQPTTTETTTPVDKPIIYALVVSFTSKGGGPDHKRVEEFLKYINEHPKKPEYKIVRWGREGESDFCFNLTEFSGKEKTAFLDGVKKIASGGDMMLIEENMEYTRGGR